MTEPTNSAATDDDRSSVENALTGTVAGRILDASPVGIAVVEPSGEISFVNARGEAILGLPATEVTDRTYEPDDWGVYSEDGAPIAFEDHPVTHVLATGEPVFGFEHWIELPDGTERWLSTNSAPVIDDGRIECVVVGFEDATELKRRERKLTSDRLRLLEIRADRTAIPQTFRVAVDDELRIDVDSVVSLPDGTTVQYMSTEDLSATEFVRGVEEVPHYSDVRLLSSAGGRCRVEAHADSGTVSGVFQTLGGRPRAIAVDTEEVRFYGELPGDVDPREAVEGIRAFHPNAELRSQELVYSPHLLYDVVEEALTDRQFAALEAAYYGGYFETPRKSTGNELAARFGVTRQTFNQHLRKAELAVFRALFERTGEDAR